MNLTVFTVFIIEDFDFFFYLKPPGENFYWYVSWETAKTNFEPSELYNTSKVKLIITVRIIAAYL